MRNRRQRSFRHRSGSRNFRRRPNDNGKTGFISPSYTNGRNNNNFKPYQSAEKLLDKYKSLAKDALSSGDRILHENYLQHADHFSRIVSNKNSNQANNQSQNTITSTSESSTGDVSKKSETEKNHTTENKETVVKD